MRVLDLFTGTGSVASYAKESGWEVITLDIDPKSNATFTIDILDFDYTKFEVGHFDLVFASPDCSVYSTMACQNIGRQFRDHGHLLEVRLENEKYVKFVLELIEFLKPKYWFIENPAWGYMRHLPCMVDKPNIIVDYCMFGTAYQKPTRFWCPQWICDKLGSYRCNHQGKHETLLGCRSKYQQKSRNRAEPDRTGKRHRYAIPKKVIEYLFSVV